MAKPCKNCGDKRQSRIDAYQRWVKSVPNHVLTHELETQLQGSALRQILDEEMHQRGLR